MVPIVDTLFINDQPFGWSVILGTIAFGVQIYADFCGYSLIAKGAALLFGFELVWNFRFPYWAVSISDFWRRWHISLSTWLRDYLYIQLGGSRRGQAPTAANLLITMGLGGLARGVMEFRDLGAAARVCAGNLALFRRVDRDNADRVRRMVLVPGNLR